MNYTSLSPFTSPEKSGFIPDYLLEKSPGLYPFPSRFTSPVSSPEKCLLGGDGFLVSNFPDDHKFGASSLSSLAKTPTYASPVKVTPPTSAESSPEKPSPRKEEKKALVPKRRKKDLAIIGELSKLAMQKNFSHSELSRLGDYRQSSALLKKSDPHAGAKEKMGLGIKLVVGTAIFPLGLYWLLRDERPTAKDIAADILYSPRTKPFYGRLQGIEEQIFKLYASFEKHDGGFFQLFAVQDILFAELIGRIYTELGVSVDMDLLVSAVGCMGIYKSKVALIEAAKAFDAELFPFLWLAGRYGNEHTLEAKLIQGVASLPSGPIHRKVYPFLTHLQSGKLMSPEEGNKLRGQIWREAQYLQSETARWKPTRTPIIDRLFEFILKNRDSLPLLYSLHDEEILSKRALDRELFG